MNNCGCKRPAFGPEPHAPVPLHGGGFVPNAIEWLKKKIDKLFGTAVFTVNGHEPEGGNVKIVLDDLADKDGNIETTKNIMVSRDGGESHAAVALFSDLISEIDTHNNDARAHTRLVATIARDYATKTEVDAKADKSALQAEVERAQAAEAQLTTRANELDTAKADKSALDTHVNNKDNPHAVTADQVGAVPFVKDSRGNKTAVTIGSRAGTVGPYSLANGNDVTASGRYSHAGGSGTKALGDYSHAEGSATTASGDYCHAEGHRTTTSGDFSHAEGFYTHTKKQDSYAFAWNGDNTRADPYESHGLGTFNVNPVGGAGGFYVGEQTLASVISGAVSDKADKATTLAGYGITDAVPLVEDSSGKKTSVTIGIRKGRAGIYSLANGNDVIASGYHSHAEGYNTASPGSYSHAEGRETTASGDYSHTEGFRSQTKVNDNFAYSWNGDGTRTEPYFSHGEGTFNVNPAGGLGGFWIGEQTLEAIINAAVKDKADKATTLAGYGITDAATKTDVEAKADKSALQAEVNRAQAAETQLTTKANDLGTTKADRTELPYSLVVKEIENGTVSLDDRADNYVDARALGSSDSLDIDFPVLVDGRSRDFVLAVECGENPPTISYAAFATIMAEDASTLTPEPGMNIYAFTEFKTNMFLVARKTVDTVVVNTPESSDQVLLAMQKRGIDTTNITDFGEVANTLGLGDTATPQDAIDAVMN